MRMNYCKKSDYIEEFQHSTPEIEDTVNNLFRKIFSFTQSDLYILPEPESMYTENPWIIEKLYQIKTELNNTKSKLNDYCLIQWNKHTRNRNKAGLVQSFVQKYIQPEFLTQAWCKFYEIISSFKLIPDNTITEGTFVSLHLCEAPGAFVASLNHWLKTHISLLNWDWIATTLNPYYEGNPIERMIIDDRFIMHTLNHWNFGPQNTGNIMDLENLDVTMEICKEKGKVYLITADGSVDCTYDPGEQEKIVAHLYYCEAVTALHILAEEGNFILKIFTIFEEKTISLIYFLACCFNTIHMFKPVTSKEGNSETYLICLKFKGSNYLNRYFPVLRKNFENNSTKAMFKRKDIPEEFINQVINCAEFFKNLQCKVILDNIQMFKRKRMTKDHNLLRIKQIVAKRFIEVYNLRKLESENLKIVGRREFSLCKNISSINKIAMKSFSERQIRDNLDSKSRLRHFLDELQGIAVLEKSYNNNQLNKIPCKLWITIVKPYCRIKSSIFLPIHILRILNQLFDIIDTMNLSVIFPTNEMVVKYLESRNYERERRKILQFQHTSEQNNYQFINKVYETLKSCKEGDDIILTGYSLLSQINVGLLNLLARFFLHFNFEPDHVIGYVIILRNFCYSDIEMKNLEELVEMSESAKSKNMIVLSVFSILDLMEPDWIGEIVNINIWNIKCLAKSIVEWMYHEENK